MHQVEAVAHGPDITVGPQIARPIFHDIAGDEYARVGFARDADEGILLVVFELDVEAETLAEAETIANEVADKLLANPVIESYRVEIE